MKTYSKTSSFLFLSCVLIVFSCNRKIDFLKEAKDKLNESNYISYIETAFYPIPESDLIDTVNTKTEVLFDDDDSLGYNFIQMSDRVDGIYQDNMLRIANHKDSIVRIYLPKHFENSDEFKKTVESNFRDKWSPMNLLKEEWEYVTDTVIDDSNFQNYYKIESDRVYEGRKIHTEHHIFINSNSFLERFERRNYIDGSLSQRVTIIFSNYKMNQKQVALNYNFPENYVSTYGKEKKLESLKVGEVAPEFSGVNIDGDSISLKMFKGQKVLLNFSVITCGYCKMALEHFNQEDYVLTDKVSVLYINPEDNETRMETYMKKTPIPFPVIAKAEDIGERYRINSYPRYFLIDEKGIIEKIQVGYSKEFIDEFRQ